MDEFSALDQYLQAQNQATPYNVDAWLSATSCVSVDHHYRASKPISDTTSSGYFPGPTERQTFNHTVHELGPQRQLEMEADLAHIGAFAYDMNGSLQHSLREQQQICKDLMVHLQLIMHSVEAVLGQIESVLVAVSQPEAVTPLSS